MTRYQAIRRRLEQIAYELHTDPDRAYEDIQSVRDILRFLRSECHGCAAPLEPIEQRLAGGWLCRRCRRAQVWRLN